jgi:predicted Abi (CAAX) family protease
MKPRPQTGPLPDARRRLERLRRTLTTAPTARDWGEFVAVAVLLYGVFAAFGLATGLLRVAPQPPATIAWIAVSALVVPAFGEEVLFRALLIPDLPGAPYAGRATLLSTALFVLWHPLQTLWFPGAAAIFLRPDFLAWTAVLGLACAWLYRRSGSLWPPVALHWLAVTAWQGWLGGPLGIGALR